ncbi:hypothetical protein ACIQOW_01360 [Kitasatospora sp. NPDC091335]|uniref:hypothetical protein n=1 Tax=Kitasatospora sp. NPDC091335 TaxID=3364085 RepID=UPI00381D1BF2
MTDADTAPEKAATKRKAPPNYSHVLTTLYTAQPGAKHPAPLKTAVFPPALLQRLQRAWASNPNARSRYLPTSALRQLVQQIEPTVVAVSGSLDGAGPWLFALRSPDDDLPLQLAVEAWATSTVAPHQGDIDWPGLIKDAFPLD